MGWRSSFCSSTGNTIFPPSTLNYDVKPKQMMSSSACFSQLQPRKGPGNRRTKHFQLKASNVQPLSPVSLKQGGIPSNSLAAEDVSHTIIKEYTPIPMKETEPALSIIVVGASGDLARKKIYPALFSLFCEDRLPKNLTIFGYGRSAMTNEEMRNMVIRTLTCRIDKRKNCREKMDQFLWRCFYHSGQYSSAEHFSELHNKLQEKEDRKQSNRLYYLAIPSNMFTNVVRCARQRASSENGWTRFIVEKPFGRDSESSKQLTRDLKQYLKEEQIFRIDHHLGEELIENLLVLRFSNLVFHTLWSRKYIRNVQIIFSEEIGVEGRGRYFDNYGIIRDVMQNHLLQVLALFAMETPVSLNAEDIRNEKVKVVRSMKPVGVDEAVIGQYKGDNVSYSAFTDDPTVSDNSLTPTFAAATIFIDNARWDGVPFLMIAGKALQSKCAEIRVQFRHVPGNLYNKKFGTDLDKATNELVIRVEPDQAIYLKINKVPGTGIRSDSTDLNLLYKSRHPREVPDVYQRLLLCAVRGEQQLFMRSDEVDAAWNIFNPLLKTLEEKRIAPELYSFGSSGPVGVHYLAAKHGVRWGDFGC